MKITRSNAATRAYTLSLLVFFREFVGSLQEKKFKILDGNIWAATYSDIHMNVYMGKANRHS